MFESAKLYKGQARHKRSSLGLATLEGVGAVRASVARRSVAVTPETERNYTACVQGCYGIANKQKFEQCVRACMCTSFPNLCEAFDLLRTPGGGRGGPSRPIGLGRGRR